MQSLTQQLRTASAIPAMTRGWTNIVHVSWPSHAALLICFCALLAQLYGALHVLIGALAPDLHHLHHSRTRHHWRFPPDSDKRFHIIDMTCLPCAALLIWFFALLAPYYGTLNALIGALTSPCIAFIFPALAFTWYFRKPERRKHAHHKPPA